MKPVKKRNLRRRDELDNSTDAGEVEDEDLRCKLETTRLLQKLRQRSVGIDIVSATVKPTSFSEDVKKVNECLFLMSRQIPNSKLKLETGGLFNSNDYRNTVEDNKLDDIGTQFSTETNMRDEDADMRQFIEDELKRKAETGTLSTVKNSDDNKNASYMTVEEQALHSVPEHLRGSVFQTSEEMLSHQMLSGIPEVDLGIDAKIKNIEATEDAKLQIMLNRNRKEEGPSQFVPTNMAVNFVQHNRFNIEDHGSSINEEKKKLLKRKKLENDNNCTTEKATDDFHFEKFKKQFRRF